MMIIAVFILALCWGSFLNMLAHRLLYEKSLLESRSRCPQCNKVIAWYDNIPLVSWIVLKAHCRSCKKPISWLYPSIEIVTAVLLTGLFAVVIPTVPDVYDCLSFFCYAVFMSALIASTRTDLEAMLIPQVFTMWLVPFGIIAAGLTLVNVFFTESILGAVVGYGVLWGVAWIFKYATGKEGLGIGDMELLALIGAFLGPVGVWVSLMLASFTGIIIGSLYLVIGKKSRSTRIPFGPFLALGAVCYFFFQPYLLHALL